jgi:type 1 glutamine amidotransferase
LVVLSALSLLAAGAAHAEQVHVLLFSKAGGWHHESIHEGVAAIRDLGKLHDFGVFWTEDASRVFNDAELKKFKVVVFLSTTGDILNDEQQAAFERFIKAGGGFVGIHAAADTEYDWPWYTKMVGHMFHIHPAVQTATIKVEDANFLHHVYGGIYWAATGNGFTAAQ